MSVESGTSAFRSDPMAHREGLALLERPHGAHSGEELAASLRSICPDFADRTVEWAIGGAATSNAMRIAAEVLGAAPASSPSAQRE
jgi:hypothetical protein